MDTTLTSLQELRLAFHWSLPREPKWYKERDDALRALLGLLPMPRLVAFLIAEYRLLLQGLRDSATTEWAGKTIDWLERELAVQQLASPIDDEDWLTMAALGPSNLRDGVRELWRAASEWHAKAEQAYLDAGDALFARASVEIEKAWDRLHPDQLAKEMQLASKLDWVEGERDEESVRAYTRLLFARTRSADWARFHDDCWSRLFDRLERALREQGQQP